MKSRVVCTEACHPVVCAWTWTAGKDDTQQKEARKKERWATMNTRGRVGAIYLSKECAIARAIWDRGAREKENYEHFRGGQGAQFCCTAGDIKKGD